jgi:hypothetical protein
VSEEWDALAPRGLQQPAIGVLDTKFAQASGILLNSRLCRHDYVVDDGGGQRLKVWDRANEPATVGTESRVGGFTELVGLAAQ